MNAQEEELEMVAPQSERWNPLEASSNSRFDGDYENLDHELLRIQQLETTPLSFTDATSRGAFVDSSPTLQRLKSNLSLYRRPSDLDRKSQREEEPLSPFVLTTPLVGINNVVSGDAQSSNFNADENDDVDPHVVKDYILTATVATIWSSGKESTQCAKDVLALKQQNPAIRVVAASVPPAEGSTRVHVAPQQYLTTACRHTLVELPTVYKITRRGWWFPLVASLGVVSFIVNTTMLKEVIPEGVRIAFAGLNVVMLIIHITQLSRGLTSMVIRSFDFLFILACGFFLSLAYEIDETPKFTEQSYFQAPILIIHDLVSQFAWLNIDAYTMNRYYKSAFFIGLAVAYSVVAISWRQSLGISGGTREKALHIGVAVIQFKAIASYAAASVAAFCLKYAHRTLWQKSTAGIICFGAALVNKHGHGQLYDDTIVTLRQKVARTFKKDDLPKTSQAVLGDDESLSVEEAETGGLVPSKQSTVMGRLEVYLPLSHLLETPDVIKSESQQFFQGQDSEELEPTVRCCAGALFTFAELVRKSVPHSARSFELKHRDGLLPKAQKLCDENNYCGIIPMAPMRSYSENTILSLLIPYMPATLQEFFKVRAPKYRTHLALAYIITILSFLIVVLGFDVARDHEAFSPSSAKVGIVFAAAVAIAGTIIQSFTLLISNLGMCLGTIKTMEFWYMASAISVLQVLVFEEYYAIAPILGPSVTFFYSVGFVVYMLGDCWMFGDRLRQVRGVATLLLALRGLASIVVTAYEQAHDPFYSERHLSLFGFKSASYGELIQTLSVSLCIFWFRHSYQLLVLKQHAVFLSFPSKEA